MSGSSGLERRYRSLLAWYPPPFRAEQSDEVLGVLMAAARAGQRWPGLMDAVDVIKSALTMRLRPRPERGNGAWSDGLALFSVIAPLFLLAAAIAEVALPYRQPATGLVVPLFRRSYEVGGLPLLGVRSFGIIVGCQMVIAALVLLGLRRVAVSSAPRRCCVPPHSRGGWSCT
jgi:hypothetical protein